MSSPAEVRIPLDNVNDDLVKLTAWLVKNGDDVKEGQIVAEVETSKALVEMAAPSAGRVWLRAESGQELRVGALIAYITVNGAEPPGSEVHLQRSQIVDAAANSNGDSSGASALPEGTTFTRKALELIYQQGLQPAVFAGRGIVREQDVKQHLSNASSARAATLHVGLKGLCLEHITLPALFSDVKSGLVDREFLEQLRANPQGFGRLSSVEKCDLYRKHGASIGEGVNLGERTVIIAPQIVLGAEVSLDADTIVNCRERFCMGVLSSFGRNLNVRGGSVVVGDDLWAGQNIRIGGGGHADPRSLLCVGDNCYLGDDLYLNIGRPILIGASVFLTQRSIVMTHNIGHSILEGYENRSAPVILEDFCQIGMYTTIYAGCVVGQRAIVGSNSYVLSSVPGGKLAIGVPARVVRDSTRPLDRGRQLQIVQTMMCDYHELLTLKGHVVSPIHTSPDWGFSVEHGGQRFRLVFLETVSNFDFPVEPAAETVVWTLNPPAVTPPDGWTVINLLAKEVSGPSGIFVNSTREFLRKKGIRCKPAPWRYRRGLI